MALVVTTHHLVQSARMLWKKKRLNSASVSKLIQSHKWPNEFALTHKQIQTSPFKTQCTQTQKPTKNNLLSVVARTWLGHLSFPCWLLSFVYPQTSWMLMADSPLVYTSGRRRKKAHCCERRLHNANEVEMEPGIPLTTGTALTGSANVHTWDWAERISAMDKHSFNMHQRYLPPSAVISELKEDPRSPRGAVFYTKGRLRGRVRSSFTGESKNQRWVALTLTGSGLDDGEKPHMLNLGKGYSL